MRAISMLLMPYMWMFAMSQCTTAPEPVFPTEGYKKTYDDQRIKQGIFMTNFKML